MHRLLEGLSEVPDETWSSPAPPRPGGDPDETIGTLLTFLVFHEAYHVGQLGVIRRALGYEGVIR